jgi:NitT/TauT family transport system substrate-binding protein
MRFIRTILAITVIASLSFTSQAKDDYKIGWSIYVGWMPWGYAKDTGIVDKWAKKYGITIDVVQFNDYIESINQYTAGAFDACTMTNMDALTIPAAGGVDSTALVVGDFSNGNDGIILKGNKSLADIKGQNVNLVELSVSHYTLARALDSIGLSERDVKVVNTSDADIVAAFTAKEVSAVVTWNPLLSEIMAMPKVSKVFDSSQIPGEIIDMLVVNTETLAADPRLGKALTGAWYETMALMQKGNKAKMAMAEASGTDLAGYNAQLDATKMFYSAAPAVEFVRSADVEKTMKNVAEFSFKHGLLGDGASDSGFIGIGFPGGKVLGSKGNIKLRFDDTYMSMAAKGAL